MNLAIPVYARCGWRLRRQVTQFKQHIRVTVNGPHMFVCVADSHCVRHDDRGFRHRDHTFLDLHAFRHGSHGISTTPAIYQTRITARVLTPGTKGRAKTLPGPARSECSASARLRKHATLPALSDAWYVRRPQSTPHSKVVEGTSHFFLIIARGGCLCNVTHVHATINNSGIGCAGLWSKSRHVAVPPPVVCTGNRSPRVCSVHPGIIEEVSLIALFKKTFTGSIIG